MKIITDLIKAILIPIVHKNKNIQKIEEEFNNKIIWTEKDDERVKKEIATYRTEAYARADRKFEELKATGQTTADKIKRGEY